MLRTALIIVALALLGAAPAHAAGTIAFVDQDCSLYTLTSVPNPCPSVLFVAAEDGSGRQRITAGATLGEPSRGGDYAPAWSSDGRSLAFTRVAAGRNELWTAAADGSQQQRVPLEGSAYSPEWTGDGRILFADPFGRLYLIARDGSGLAPVTPEGEQTTSHSVTPDGHVTYMTADFGVAGSQAPHAMETTIWKADPATGVRERIFFGDYMLGWGDVSPDGRWMALGTSRAGAYRLQTLGLDGSGLVDRAGIFDRSDGSFNGDAAWAGPDRLLLRGFAGGRLPLWSFDLSAGEPQLLAEDLHGGSIAWRPTGAVQAPDDDAPPVVTVEKPRAALATASVTRRYTRIPLMAADATGLERVEASLARVVRRGCRYATPSGRLGPVRACKRPRFRAVDGVGAWARITDPLPRGRYELRFRARDTQGNRGRMRVRLRLRSPPR